MSLGSHLVEPRDEKLILVTYLSLPSFYSCKTILSHLYVFLSGSTSAASACVTVFCVTTAGSSENRLLTVNSALKVSHIRSIP